MSNQKSTVEKELGNFLKHLFGESKTLTQVYIKYDIETEIIDVSSSPIDTDDEETSD